MPVVLKAIRLVLTALCLWTVATGGGTTGGGTTGGGTTGGGIADWGSYNQNQSYTSARALRSVIDPVTGYKVFIVDEGLSSTYAPSCINGLSSSSCASRRLWNSGAKTNEVWSVRLKSRTNYVASSLTAGRIAVGLGKVHRSAKFDFVLSSKPGLMTSDFKVAKGGRCELRNTSTGTIGVVSPQYSHIFKGCVVPTGQQVYMNIRAVSSVCDQPGVLCNSSFKSGSAF